MFQLECRVFELCFSWFLVLLRTVEREQSKKKVEGEKGLIVNKRTPEAS
jgi:hypothetical protein